MPCKNNKNVHKNEPTHHRKIEIKLQPEHHRTQKCCLNKTIKVVDGMVGVIRWNQICVFFVLCFIRENSNGGGVTSAINSRSKV
eukprot:UN27137